MWGLSLVAASGGHSSLRCAGLSLSRPLWLWSTGSRRAGSVVVAHGPSCSAACGIFPDQGSNPCLLHWQADSQPPRHQGSPVLFFFNVSYEEWINCSVRKMIYLGFCKCSIQSLLFLFSFFWLWKSHSTVSSDVHIPRNNHFKHMLNVFKTRLIIPSIYKRVLWMLD